MVLFEHINTFLSSIKTGIFLSMRENTNLQLYVLHSVMLWIYLSRPILQLN
jgi:hypothetical protein